MQQTEELGPDESKAPGDSEIRSGTEEHPYPKRYRMQMGGARLQVDETVRSGTWLLSKGRGPLKGLLGKAIFFF